MFYDILDAVVDLIMYLFDLAVGSILYIVGLVLGIYAFCYLLVFCFWGLSFFLSIPASIFSFAQSHLFFL